MKIQALYDLQSEINRLFIAGSKFAKDDPRLSKHIPILNKLGEKAPVFKKLAQEIGALIKTEPSESPQKLLEISTLLYSILYTQGETSIDGDTELRIPLLDVDDIIANVPYSQLQPLIKALTTSAGGRMTVIEEGLKNNLYEDFRTWDAVNRALDDKYAELAAFAETKIIPSTGSKITPLIKASFKADSNAQGDVRRLRILYRTGDKDIYEIVDSIIKGDSIPLTGEAVKILGDDVKNFDTVAKFADDKHKPIRESAYYALAKMNTDESIDKLVSVFLKNRVSGNIDGIVDALKNVPIDKYLPEIIEKIENDFNSYVSLPDDAKAKDVENAFERFGGEAKVLFGRKNREAIDFLKKTITSPEFVKAVKKRNKAGNYYVSADNFVNETVANLYKNSCGERYGIFKALMQNKTASAWKKTILNFFFLASSRVVAGAELFDEFADYFEKNQIDTDTLYYVFGDVDDNNIVYNCYNNSFGSYSRESEFNNIDKADKRWADVLLKKFKNFDNDSDLLKIAGMIVGKKDPRIAGIIDNELKKVAKSRRISYSFGQLAEYAVEHDVPDAVDSIMRIFTDTADQSNRYIMDYALDKLAESPAIKKFPQSCVKQFDDLADKHGGKYRKAARAVEKTDAPE